MHEAKQGCQLLYIYYFCWINVEFDLSLREKVADYNNIRNMEGSKRMGQAKSRRATAGSSTSLRYGRNDSLYG